MKRKRWTTRQRRSQFLRKHPACNGKVGAVGFCLGGNLAYLLSVRYKPDCAVGYYGVSIEKSLEEAGNLSSPLCCTSPAAINIVRLKLKHKSTQALDANPLATICDYAEQDHAFARPGGEHYDAGAAELANLRTLEFFLRNLAGRARRCTKEAFRSLGRARQVRVRHTRYGRHFEDHGGGCLRQSRSGVDRWCGP